MCLSMLNIINLVIFGNDSLIGLGLYFFSFMLACKETRFVRLVYGQNTIGNTKEEGHGYNFR